MFHLSRREAHASTRATVGNTRIPKYWEYEQGIDFKVLDPQFFVEPQGKHLRFTQDEVEFVDAGAPLGAPAAVPAAATRRLRTQEEASSTWQI